MKKIEEISDDKWEKINPENKKMVEEFLRQNIQLSPETISQYASALKIYFYWIFESAENKPFHKIKSREFLQFQNWLIERGMSSSGVKLKRSSVSSFNNYVEVYYADEYPMFRNYITKGIPLPVPSAVHKKEPLTSGEYESLCLKLEEMGLYQQLAYLKFSFSSAARRAEVRQLLISDMENPPKEIQSNGKTIKVYNTSPIRCKGRGKIGKIRPLQFDDDARSSILKWLEIRGKDDCPYVFVAKHDNKYTQISKATFNSWTETYFTDIVGRRVHPHLFRSTRATILTVEQGRDIRAAQKLLGHKSSTTTESYVVRKDAEDADEAFI